MKICKKCNMKKTLNEFGSHATATDGYHPNCKVCVSEYNKQYRVANHQRLIEKDRKYIAEHREEANSRTKQWIKDNIEQKSEYDKSYYRNNKEELNKKHTERYDEKAKIRAKKWREDNPDRVAATLAKRRADKKKATPLWFEMKDVQSLYTEAQRLTEETGTPYQVDHMFPLSSKEVCGLHCKDNLRVITAEENNTKNNKLLQDFA